MSSIKGRLPVEEMLMLNLNEPGAGVCVFCMHVCECLQRLLCVWENLEEGWDISGSDLEQKLAGEKYSEVAGVYSVCVSVKLRWGA